jgi:cytochrome b
VNKVKVFDLPTRIFHWLFVALFIFSFIIAKTVDDDSPVYAYHMLAGFILAILVCLRVVWGFVGSRYSRFSSFRFSLKELKQYFSSIISTKGKQYIGHNPASSYATLGMLGFALGLALTGILMSKGINKHFFEEVHELCAGGLLVTAILHVSGVVLHQIKYRDGIHFSMLSGDKYSQEDKVGIKSSRPILALFFVGLIIALGPCLNHAYDQNTQRLNILGVYLELGEGDHKDEHEDDD